MVILEDFSLRLGTVNKAYMTGAKVFEIQVANFGYAMNLHKCSLLCKLPPCEMFGGYSKKE